MKKILAILVGIVLLVIIYWLINTIKFVSWDFRNNLWGPTHLIWSGGSAYKIKTLFPDSNAIWFPQIIGLFLPLGLLPENQATNLWLTCNIILLLGLTWFLSFQAAQGKPKPIYLGILVFTVFLFPPTVTHLTLGQVDILILASVISGTYAIERNRLVLGGFLFAIALVKPQQCIVFLPGIIAYLLFSRREWRSVLKLLLATCFWGFALTTPLWLSSPGWTNDFLYNLLDNPNWSQPTIFSILSNKFGILGIFFWFILYIMILALSIQIWLKYKLTNAVLWSLALTTLINPYMWSWDFVLLLPLYIYTAIRLSNTLARLSLLFFYIGCFILSIISLQLVYSDAVLWWFPLTLIIGITASIIINQKHNQECKLDSGIIFNF